MGQKKRRRTDASSTPGFGGTLGDLLRARGLAPPPEDAPAEPAPAAEPPPSPTLADCPRLVVRRERKGRGGKTVVRVEGLASLGDAALEVAGRLRRALGCGAALDGGDLIVQGDQRDRVAEWLEREGAPRVIRG